MIVSVCDKPPNLRVARYHVLVPPSREAPRLEEHADFRIFSELSETFSQTFPGGNTAMDMHRHHMFSSNNCLKCPIPTGVQG